MTDILLIDNSNIIIGLQKRNYPFKKERFDYGEFLNMVFEQPSEVEKILVGSTSFPKDTFPKDTFWENMKSKGFEVITFERGRNGEKQVDTEIVAQGLDAIGRYENPGKLVLMSGDADMNPLVKRAHSRGWFVELWTWNSDIKLEYSQSENIDTIKYIDDYEEDLVYHEQTSDDPHNETLRYYRIRSAREKEEKRRLEKIEKDRKREEQRIIRQQRQKKLEDVPIKETPSKQIDEDTNKVGVGTVVGGILLASMAIAGTIFGIKSKK